MSAANDIQDEFTLRDINVDRYRRHLAAETLGVLARMEEDIVKRLTALDPNAVKPSFKQARLARILADVQQRIDRYGKALEERIYPEMMDLARDEAAFGVATMAAATPNVPGILTDFATPSVALLEAAIRAKPFSGKILKDWIKDYTPGVKQRLRQTITQGVAEGATIDELVRKVRGTRANGFKDGVMETNRRAAEALVRTAVNHTVNVARETTYAENEDIIKGVKWVSTLDSRTSDVCMSRDGTVYPMNSGPRPPAHPNCRSTTVPVLKSWKELGISLPEAPEGTRASMDGQVPAKLTYDAWLRTRSKAFQNEVLGPGRAELFRNGLTLDKFVDNSGQSYTLAQLRAKSQGAAKPQAPPKPPPPPRDLNITEDDLAEMGWQNVNATEAGMELWNKRVKMDPRVVARDLTGPGLSFDHTDRDMSFRATRSPSTGEISSSFTGKLVNDKGVQVGFMERTFRTEDGDLAVHHDFFKLKREHQGTGYAKTALKSQFAVYERMGVKKVDVQAALDKGAYVWGKFGLKPYESEWINLREEVGETLRSLHRSGTINNATRDKVLTILKQDDPRALWLLSDLDDVLEDGGKLGVALLTYKSWHGEIRLDDAEAMARFKAYVEKKK